MIAVRDSFINSKSWRITKLLQKIYDFIRQNTMLRLFTKFFLSLKRKGIRVTVKKVVKYTYMLIKSWKVLSHSKIDYIPYESEYQENMDFSKFEPRVKAIVFYLPQFHAIPENDMWWGKGFTEWTNTNKANPRFEGHYQPREPHDDFGYYNLTDIETIKKQALLAKQHGIYGFCFYLYWFSGKQLLEKPLDLFLEHPEIDIKFCLCWANENWTRRWDGLNDEVLICQEYTDNDPIQFIYDIKKYTDDSRYIRINKKPVIIVYNPGHIPNLQNTFQKWRDCARKIGIGEILIWTCQTVNNTAKSLNIIKAIDAEVEFPPHNIWHQMISVKNLYIGEKKASIYNYKMLVDILEKQLKTANKRIKNPPVYHCAMMGWDNAARKDNYWTTFYAYSLKSFYKWLNLIIDNTCKYFENDKRFIFINAWNEWAEGTYLEPDKKYGYANINTLSKALFSLPFDN